MARPSLSSYLTSQSLESCKGYHASLHNVHSQRAATLLVHPSDCPCFSEMRKQLPFGAQLSRLVGRKLDLTRVKEQEGGDRKT